jgi:hypothetical protein
MHQGRTQALADALGWASLALGAAELLMPQRLARATGLKAREGLIPLYGVREIVAGLAILLLDRKLGMWARVAGDALDIATLAEARSRKALPALAAVAGVTALDLYTALRVRDDPQPQRVYDYRSRSGFPRPAAEMRGRARKRREEKASREEPAVYSPS